MKLLAVGSNPTNITTTPPALAVNTCPANAKSFELQGRSLVLNQFFGSSNARNVDYAGLIYTKQSNGTYTITGTCETGDLVWLDYAYIPVGHTVFLQSSSSNIVVYFESSSKITDSALITTASDTGSENKHYFGIKTVTGQTYNETAFYINLIDLTQTFGAGFEPTTVDQLQSIIDLSKYIPFNPGTFIHNNATYEVNKWNQLVSNISIASDTRGLTITKNDDGTITVSGQPTSTGNIIIGSGSDGYISGHKYLLCGLPKGLSSINLNRYLGGNLITDSGDGAIGTASSTGGTSDAFRINVSSTSQTYNFTFAPLFVDLTDIFGAGKEPSTVDECKLRFLAMGIDITKYQPYSPLGSNLGGKVDLGFNVWDEEWKMSHIVSGQEVSDGTYRLISANYIPVIPDATYFFHCGISCGATLYAYDQNKSYLRYIYDADNVETTVIIPSDVYFIKLQMYAAYGSSASSTYNHDICINESQTDTTKSPHNGDYRPYLMLRGIGSNFNVWDEEWEAIGQNIYNKNPIKVVAGAVYYFKIGTSNFATIRAVDENNQSLGGIAYSIANGTVTIPANVRYMGFTLNSVYGTTYKNDICINLSQPQITINPHNGQYVPHLFDTYDSMSGILTRRISAVDLGAQTWSGGTNGKWRTTITPANNWVANNTKIYALAEKYEIATANDIYYDVVTVPSIGGEDSDGHLYCYTGSSSIQPSGMFLYELVADQVFTPTSKIGVVDMGSLSWTRVDVTGSGGYVFSTPATPLQMYKQSDNLWCSGYTTGHYSGTGSVIYNYGDKTIAQHTPSGEFNIYVRDDSYTSVSAFTNAVKGKILTYELSDSVSQTTITQPISFVVGKLGKQYGVVDLGSLEYAYQSTYHYFYARIRLNARYNVHPLLYSSRYSSVETEYTASSNIPDKSITFLRDGNPQEGSDAQYLRINDFAFTDATAFKNSLQGQYLIYKLVDGATDITYATAGNLIQKTNGDIGDVDFNLKYWQMKDIKLLKAGKKFLSVND